MSKDEFKTFFSKLRTLFPFANKGEEDVKRWWLAMKDVPFDSAMTQLDTTKRQEDLLPASLRKDPDPTEVAHGATAYNGIGDLMWRALEQRRKERERRDERT